MYAFLIYDVAEIIQLWLAELTFIRVRAEFCLSEPLKDFMQQRQVFFERLADKDNVVEVDEFS